MNMDGEGNKMRYSRLFVVSLFVVVLLPVSAGAVGPGKTLTWPGGGKGQVLFKGGEHAKKGLGCKDCHPGLFKMKKGSTTITMAALNEGKYCGACHNGTTAFNTADPTKCHECHKGVKEEKGHGKRKEHRHEHDHD
jgi:c(7)-type cytochrome triheme protein